MSTPDSTTTSSSITSTPRHGKGRLRDGGPSNSNNADIIIVTPGNISFELLLVSYYSTTLYIP
jgi:hypothetical protein